MNVVVNVEAEFSKESVGVALPRVVMQVVHSELVGVEAVVV